MFKRQKSKILVFLLMLGLLYGCKRQILDPLSPQTNLPQKVKLDKVKDFYEKGRYKNQPKRTSSNGNKRMTAQDSARFKDFEPQWDKTEVELLPNNEKMLIVPVVRFLRVDYNENLAFVRRLCIRVDANDDFIEANIVDIVGSMFFLPNNYKKIFSNYKNINISYFTGAIFIYELDYTLQKSTFYVNSVLEGNAITQTARPVSNCTLIFTTWIPPASCPNEGQDNHTGWFCGTSGGGYWETTYELILCDIEDGDGTSTGGTSSGGTNPGGHGGSGTSGGVGNPRDNGCSFCLDENMPPPSVTGTIYTNAKTNADNIITNLIVDLVGQDTSSQEVKAKYRMLKGLKQMRAIMTKIETNTKKVDLHVVASATDSTGGTQYDVANNRLLITMPSAPVLPANPTPKQEEKYERDVVQHIALLAHELKHVEQYLDGKISFNKVSGGQGVLVDASDEVECYTLQFLIQGELNIKCSTITQIKAFAIYANLPDGPLGTNNPPAPGLSSDFYIQP